MIRRVLSDEAVPSIAGEIGNPACKVRMLRHAKYACLAKASLLQLLKERWAVKNTGHPQSRCFGMQSTNAASKERMLNGCILLPNDTLLEGGAS